MTINKKLVTLLVCAVVMTVGAISATMAYFTDSDAAVNTFTVGHVDITLDEAKVDELGNKILDENGQPVARVTENEYKLIPGSTYLKDPTVHVTADSDDCWLFVTVDNQIAALEVEEDIDVEGTESIAEQMAANGWEPMGTYKENDKEIPLYKYVGTDTDPNGIVQASENKVVFSNFTIDGDKVTDEMLNGDAPFTESYDGKTIIVKAYAIQAAGFASAEDAWKAASGQFK